MKEMERCPLCGNKPKLSAYRDGVWVDVSCSNPECKEYYSSARCIKTAINSWNEYARSTRLTQAASEMYELLGMALCSLRKHSDNDDKIAYRIKTLLARIDGEEADHE